MGHPLVVNGVTGRMGRLVAEALVRAGFGPVAGCHRSVMKSASGSTTPGTISMTGLADLVSELEPGGVVVDFSHPDATSDLVRAARERSARLVVGTTGQTPEQLAALREVASRVPVLVARNFALGLNRLLEVLPALRILIDEGFDVEFLEAHHRGKRDAPSGTTLAWLDAFLGDAVATPRVHGRLGAEAGRGAGEVGVHSLRLGGLVGEHALLLGSDHEVIEIRHQALDRAAFVTGVVPAVRFVRERGPGFYSMRDVMRHAATADA